MDYDSEAENDPQWMKDKTQMVLTFYFNFYLLFS
jgi:hypothetical protein